MFAGKHRPGAADSLRQAADRAFEAPLVADRRGPGAGEVVGGDPQDVGTVAFAAFQGLASLANAGMLEPDDGIVAAAVERLVLGLRPR